MNYFRLHILIITIILQIWLCSSFVQINTYNNVVHVEDFQITNEYPVTKEDYKNQFRIERLSHKWAYFEKLLKPEIRIKLNQVNESEIKIGQSKIGGRPDVPENFEWPTDSKGKHLVFLAQFNFEEISNEEIDLPQQGMLYFFYSEDQEFWGYSKEGSDAYRTIFVSTALNLKRAETPKTIKRITDGCFKSCKISFLNAYGLPNWEHDFVRSHIENGRESDSYFYITVGEEYQTKLFGHSNNIQGVMEFECEMIDQGYTWDNLNEATTKSIKAKQYNWNLLFQLDSEEAAEMMWGDVGRLYFWIKKEDLESRRFDKTWMILQCT